MAEATRMYLEPSPTLASTPARDDAGLRDALRHCSPTTYKAALRFRQNGRPEYLPVILTGLLERYLDPGAQSKLSQLGSDDLRLIEDLELDSLTLMEIVIRLEDVLRITVGDGELRQIRTLGEVRQLVLAKAGAPA